jgi:hypothetical protein
MSDCCAPTCQSENKPATQKIECPTCQQLAVSVSKRTMMQHIKDVWDYRFSDEPYYFCHTPDCDVVYFTESGESLRKDAVRTRIGIKEQDDSALICYCFGVSKAVAATNKAAKEFVIKQTRESSCACETTNPSGRCCLKDFPK